MFKKLKVLSPDNNPVTDPEPFNLMFKLDIGNRPPSMLNFFQVLALQTSSFVAKAELGWVSYNRCGFCMRGRTPSSVLALC